MVTAINIRFRAGTPDSSKDSPQKKRTPCNTWVKKYVRFASILCMPVVGGQLFFAHPPIVATCADNTDGVNFSLLPTDSREAEAW